MYQVAHDPYCYRGSRVLKNKQGLRNQPDLDRYELAMTTQRFAEGLPSGRFDVAHYRRLHRHLFQDVYTWAGRYRSVRIAKGASMFCYPENIAREMDVLFGNLAATQIFDTQSADQFAVASVGFLAHLNAIHPFRDGNGRSQLAFLVLLANRAGYRLYLKRLRQKPFLVAMIESFLGRSDLLASQISGLIRKGQRTG